jgi:putative transposase
VRVAGGLPQRLLLVAEAAALEVVGGRDPAEGLHSGGASAGTRDVWKPTAQELKSQGLTAGRHRVARLMREQGLRGLPRRRAYRVTTTRTDPSLSVAPNTLDRGFSTAQLNQVWVSDLTYLQTQEGWLYLGAILDLGSRRIVGWSLADNLGTQLPLQALRMALGHREAAKLHHSDRGCQYASTAYRSELAKHGIECSMSRRGNCWDNAPWRASFPP